MSRNCEDIPCIYFDEYSLFCLLIPYMGNRRCVLNTVQGYVPKDCYSSVLTLKVTAGNSDLLSVAQADWLRQFNFHLPAAGGIIGQGCKDGRRAKLLPRLKFPEDEKKKDEKSVQQRVGSLVCIDS